MDAARRLLAASSLALLTLSATPRALAAAPEDAPTAHAKLSAQPPPRWRGGGWRLRAGRGLLRVGMLFEALGEREAAAALYLNAATYLGRAGDVMRLRAASLLLEAREPWRAGLARVAAEGALTRPVPGRGLLQARAARALTGQLDPTLIARALDDGATREPTCDWLLAQLPSPDELAWAERAQALAPEARARLGALAALTHRRCRPHERTSWALEAGAPLTPDDHLARADLHYGKVEFYATLAALDRIEEDQLSPKQRCRATFRRARASYRIRKMRRAGAPDALYERVARECKPWPRWRVRALYAVGKRAFQLDRLARSERFFEQLLRDYPGRSHADDALMYLARIARARGDRDAELGYLERALREHPGGDMVHELVWEAHEATLRAGQWREFIEAIEALELPEHDDQYFSQGRLGYFVGRAHAELSEPGEARAAWARTWRRYPFSFYGYLSWLKLREAGASSEELAFARQPDLGWLFDETWRATPSAMLAEARLYDWAAQLEALEVARRPSEDPRQLWRLAWLRHRAGDTHISHNIARRRIPGRPWARPEAGRLVRWVIAWPNPYGELVAQAVDAEAAQHDPRKARLRPELPLAIMREESSFIPDIESYAGALGLMQLMPRTARGHDADIPGEATPERLRTPAVNVRVAADHLFMLADVLESHPVLMTAAYNAGAGAVRSWLKRPRSRDIGLWVEDIPYLQARGYTKRVIGSYLAYQWLLGHDTFDDRVGDPARR